MLYLDCDCRCNISKYCGGFHKTQLLNVHTVVFALVVADIATDFGRVARDVLYLKLIHTEVVAGALDFTILAIWLSTLFMSPLFVDPLTGNMFHNDGGALKRRAKMWPA